MFVSILSGGERNELVLIWNSGIWGQAETFEMHLRNEDSVVMISTYCNNQTTLQ